MINHIQNAAIPSSFDTPPVIAPVLSWPELKQAVRPLRWIEQDIEATNIHGKMPDYYTTWRPFQYRIIQAIRKSSVVGKRHHLTVAIMELRSVYWRRTIRCSHERGAL